MTPLVQTCTPEEAARIIAALGPDPLDQHAMLSGWVDAWCREPDGDVAWEIHQPNLITDLGRAKFFRQGYPSGSSGLFVITSPSTETPTVGRHGLGDDGSTTAGQVSTPITTVYDSLTLTKTWSHTFAAPSGARQIGTIALGQGWASLAGAVQLSAYTRLSPLKTQGTTQTLEVQYRITLTPIY